MSELPGDKMGKVSDLKSVSWSFGGHSFGPCEVKDFQVLPLSNMIRSCLSRRWSFSSDVSGFSRDFDKDLLEYIDESRHEMLAILATSRRRGRLVVEVDVGTIKANVDAGAKNGETVQISKEKNDLKKKSWHWDFSLDNEGGDQEKRCMPWRFSGENLEAKVGNLEDVHDDSMIDGNDGAMSPISDFNPHDYKPVNIFDEFDNESVNDDGDDNSFNGIQNNANDFLREVNEVVNSAVTKTACSSGVAAHSFGNDDHNEDNLASNAHEFLQMLNRVVDVVETEKMTDSTAHAEAVTTNFAFGLLQENGLPWKLNLDPQENILEELEDIHQENSPENCAEANNANKSCDVPHEEVPMDENCEPSRNIIILSENEDDSEAARQNKVFINCLLAQYKDKLDHVQRVLNVLATFKGDSAQTLHSMGMELFKETPTLLEQFFVAYPWARNPGSRGTKANSNVVVADMEQEGFGNLKETDEIIEEIESWVPLSEDKDKCADGIKDLDGPTCNEKSTRCKRKDTRNDVTDEPAPKVRRKEVNSVEEESYSSLDDDWMDKMGLLGWKPEPPPIEFSLKVLDENFGDELFHSKRSLEKTVFGKTIDQVNENEDDLTYLIERQDDRKNEEDLTDLIEDEDKRKLKSVGARKLRSKKNLTNKFVSGKGQSLKMDKKNKRGNNKSKVNSKLSTLKNNPTKLGKIPEETSSEMETTTIGECDQTQQLENLSKCANEGLEKTFELAISGPQTRRKRTTMFKFNNSGRKVNKRISGRFKKNKKMPVKESTACQRINKRNCRFPGLFEKTSNKSVQKSKVKQYRAMFEKTSNEAVVEDAGNINVIKPVGATIQDTENILADSTDTAIGDSLVDIMNELSDDTIDNSAANFMSEEVSEALMDDSVVKEVMSELMDDIAEEEALTKSSLTKDKSFNESVDALERSKSNSTYVELNEDDWRSRTLTVEEISSIPFASPEEVSEYFSFERPRNPTPTTASTNFDFDLDLFDEVTPNDCSQVNTDTGPEETSDLPHPSNASQKHIKNTPINTSINFNNEYNSVSAHPNSDFQRQLRAMSTDIPERTETPLSSRPDTALESDRSSSALSTGRDMPVLDW